MPSSRHTSTDTLGQEQRSESGSERGIFSWFHSISDDGLIVDLSYVHICEKLTSAGVSDNTQHLGPALFSSNSQFSDEKSGAHISGGAHQPEWLNREQAKNSD